MVLSVLRVEMQTNVDEGAQTAGSPAEEGRSHRLVRIFCGHSLVLWFGRKGTIYLRLFTWP